MPYFGTSRVYTIDRQSGSLDKRPSADVQPYDLDQSTDTYRKMFRATGLHRMDFAVFGASFTDDDVHEHGLLVLSEQCGVGMLADADFLEENPHHLTAELAKKIATISRDELEQFTIQPVLNAVAKRFPNARGFSK